jgi:hypothetical protein
MVLKIVSAKPLENDLRVPLKLEGRPGQRAAFVPTAVTFTATDALHESDGLVVVLAGAAVGYGEGRTRR